LTLLYAVRCNFRDEARRAAWETWYSGPKQDWMLGAPGIVAGQRFEAEAVTDAARYLALYAVESDAFFNSAYYRAGWGWAEWQPHIVGWSRTLFDGVGDAFLAGSEQRLHVVFAASPTTLAAAAGRHPNLSWAPAIGLDRTYSGVGVGLVDLGAALAGAEPGTVEGIFRPISSPRRS